MRRVFCQKKNGELISSNTYCAWEGFRLKGYQTLFFEGEFESDELENIHLSMDDIVCGYISIIRRVFDRLNVPQPDIVDIPKELYSFCGRDIRHGTLQEIHKMDMNIQPVFIKPQKIQKAFTGHVVNCFRDLIKTSSFPMEMPIQISQPVNFISEYRGFVLRKKLIGLSHYKGDFTIIPNAKIISQAIEAYVSQPIAYSIDFGITDDNKSLLVEVNDAFALGNYGLNSYLYSDMIQARWDEIVNN